MHSYGVKLFYVFFAVVFASAVGAQTMYKCGSSFQDRPCNRIGEGNSIGKTVSNSTSVGTIESSVCAARGEQARKIMWAREVGRTRDEQLQVATTDSERQLIVDVYQLRGSSGAVASAIQEKCVADKEKESRLAAEAAATAALRVSLSGGG